MAIPERLTAELLSREPGRAVLAALQRLLDRDAYLFAVDANERSISFRCGMYLQARVPDMDVDCEYNRDGIDPKRLRHMDLNPDEEDTDAQTVFPDVIVHRRGRRDQNYLVIEIKKSTNRVTRDADIRKLLGYKETLHYEHALFIELAAGDQLGLMQVRWIDV